MRFLLYNIRYAAGIGHRFHLPFPGAGYLKNTAANFNQIVDFIRSQDPDIVGLVEVDSGSFRTGRSCQAQTIARELGHFHVTETKYGKDTVISRVPVVNRQSNALLSREPILEHRLHYFQEGIKRLVIEARLPDLTVFLVHLSLTYRNRQQQLEGLYQLVHDTRTPVVVAGDFNVFWGERELQLFLGATGLMSANRNGQPSHPSQAPKRQLDFILYSRELVVNRFSVPDVRYSDHAPLLCDFGRR